MNNLNKNFNNSLFLMMNYYYKIYKKLENI